MQDLCEQGAPRRSDRAAIALRRLRLGFRLRNRYAIAPLKMTRGAGNRFAGRYELASEFSIYRFAVRYETRKRVSFATRYARCASEIFSNCGALSDCIVWSFRGRGPQNLRELLQKAVRERKSVCDPFGTRHCGIIFYLS